MADARQSLRRKPKLTPKQRVLQKYPEAVCLPCPGECCRQFDVWHRIDTAGLPLGSARSPVTAWKLAAMRIEL
jgi:hypothetical protein